MQPNTFLSNVSRNFVHVSNYFSLKLLFLCPENVIMPYIPPTTKIITTHNTYIIYNNKKHLQNLQYALKYQEL